jgi:hypothetical protein
MHGATYTERLQSIVDRYRKCGQPWPATARTIAAWAIAEKLWSPQRSTLIGQCAELLSRAMREEYITDPQGRTVRAKHAARLKREGEQAVLWEDIRTAAPEHIQIAFQQRRQQIVGDCRQLKTDVDSYNDNTNLGTPIQLVLDFTDDVAELEVLATIDA